MTDYQSIGGGSDGCGSAYVYRKWCGIRRSTWLLLIYVVTYIGFLVMGGIVMRVLEVGNEVQMRQELRATKTSFLQRYPAVNGEEASPKRGNTHDTLTI